VAEPNKQQQQRQKPVQAHRREDCAAKPRMLCAKESRSDRPSNNTRRTARNVNGNDTAISNRVDGETRRPA
jgi:hypothetical protein